MNMKTMTMIALGACAVSTVWAEPPEEEKFGQRVWFRQDGTFADGNYRDYFMRSFAGDLKRNQEGYKGYVCDLAYADSRPFPVEPGKTYTLKMKAFNCGMKPGVTPKKTIEKMRFPGAFTFYRGGEDYSNAWKVVSCVNHRVKDEDCPKGMVRPVLPAAWTDVAVTFTVPAESTMFCWSYGYVRDSNVGRVLVAEVKLEEEK